MTSFLTTGINFMRVQTAATIETFILAMTLHPDVARRAQREIDEITGGPNARMPTFADRKNMPYTECVLKEVFRYVSQYIVQMRY